VQRVCFLLGLLVDDKPQVVQLLYKKVLQYNLENTFVAGLYHMQGVFGRTVIILVI
jgi:hypothetical protein